MWHKNQRVLVLQVLLFSQEKLLVSLTFFFGFAVLERWLASIISKGWGL